MLSEATDRKLVRNQKPMTTQPPPKVSESLPCPRCDSTSTKFCYYNNYNLSQPRHFCKSCRRYWTQGGTLRNIPVGGVTRKNSKRTRTGSASATASSAVAAASAATNSSSCSSTETHERLSSLANPVSALPCGNPEMGLVMTTSDVNLNESVNVTRGGSFTNMLNMQVQGQDFLGLGGFHGYGIGSGLDELELGFGTTRSWEIPGADYPGGTGAVSGCNTWQLMNRDDQGGNNGGGGGEDCFGWSGLAISTPGVKGLK